MVNGGISRFAKFMFLVFTGIWAALLFTGGPVWTTAALGVLLGTILGKMWDIEAQHWIQKFDQITIQLGEDNE